MRWIIVSLLLLGCQHLFSQEPYLSVSYSIKDCETCISRMDEFDIYYVGARNPLSYESNKYDPNYLKTDTVYSWGTTETAQVKALVIINSVSNDTMYIAISTDFCLVSSVTMSGIPFQPGYFEPLYQRPSGCDFEIHPDYVWTPVEK